MLLYPFSLALAIYHRELWLIQGMAIARCSPANIYTYNSIPDFWTRCLQSTAHAAIL